MNKDRQRNYSCTVQGPRLASFVVYMNAEQLAREQLNTVCVETIHNNIYPPFDYAYVPATEEFSSRQ